MLGLLFLSFLKIGAFSFGGGYAAIPLIQESVVDTYGWLTAKEFTDLITISQMTPGPIAINAATFIGQKVAGFPGAIIATLGVVLPSILLVTLLVYIYMKYRELDAIKAILNSLRPAVVAMIATSGVDIFITAIWGDHSALTLSSANYLMVGLFVLAVFALRKTRLSPIIIMFASGFINLLVSALFK